MKSRWEHSSEQRVLYCDFSNFGRDVTALTAEVDAADEEILRQPHGSVLLLADLRGTVTTSAVVEIFKKSSARTKGFVRKQSVVGLTGFQRVLVQAVAWFSRETYVLFDTPQEAMIWLLRDDAEGGLVVRGG